MKVKQQQHISIFVGCGSLHPPLHNAPTHKKTRRRMARERRGAGSSLVSMETPYYKTIY